MTEKSDTTNLSLIKSGRPKGSSAFDAVFRMEEDIHMVIDYTSVLANGLLDEDVPPEIGTGLCRVACDARQAGHRLMKQFNTALELARQEKRA
jgi:hypothetical protein